jgi:hypothetical protein
MKNILGTLLIVFGFFAASSSQELSREQKIQNILDLRAQITSLENEILKPDTNDLNVAQTQGLDVIRLMPREKYDRVLAINGGGSYYSFVLKSQAYGQGSDIGLERGNLKVGFAGADYGFMADLGPKSIAEAYDSAENGVFSQICPTDLRSGHQS